MMNQEYVPTSNSFVILAKKLSSGLIESELEFIKSLVDSENAEQVKKTEAIIDKIQKQQADKNEIELMLSMSRYWKQHEGDGFYVMIPQPLYKQFMNPAATIAALKKQHSDEIEKITKKYESNFRFIIRNFFSGKKKK